MKQRQDPAEAVVLEDLEDGQCPFQIGLDIVVRQFDAFGAAGRTGGKQDNRGIVGTEMFGTVGQSFFRHE